MDLRGVTLRADVDAVAAAAAAAGVDPWSLVLGGGEDHALVACFPDYPPHGWRVIGSVRRTTTVSVPTTLRGGDNGNREFTLTISDAETASAVAVTITTATKRCVIADSTLPTGAHGYFEALVARADHWKSFSLRDQAQIDLYSQDKPTNEDVTYSPQTDTDDNAQDAAKIVIPAFKDTAAARVGANINDTTLTIPLWSVTADVPNGNTAFNAKASQIKIGDEIMITDANDPFDRATGVLTVQTRGAYGTTAASHLAGASVFRCGNSLGNQVRVPMGTTNGNTYLFTWDTFHTHSWMKCDIGNYKAHQFSSGGGIWLEPQTHFGGDGAAGFDADLHVARVATRSYNIPGGLADYASNPVRKGGWLGPGVVDNNPLRVSATYPAFIIHPNRWTRWWYHIEQRADNYDLVDLWVADEVQDPVQIYSQVPVQVLGTWSKSLLAYTGTEDIDQWYIEFNTSTAFLPAGRVTASTGLGGTVTLDAFRDLVAYVRNFAALINPPTDVSSLLVKPE
jgi:hypothetical protein